MNLKAMLTQCDGQLLRLNESKLRIEGYRMALSDLITIEEKEAKDAAEAAVAAANATEQGDGNEPAA